MNAGYRITDTNKWISVWHGIPYKKMFVDLDIKHLSGAIRYGLAYDCMISMSDFYTNTFLKAQCAMTVLSIKWAVQKWIIC